MPRALRSPEALRGQFTDQRKVADKSYGTCSETPSARAIRTRDGVILYPLAPPVLRSCATAVTSCAGANGLVRRMLFGTPSLAQSSGWVPVT